MEQSKVSDRKQKLLVLNHVEQAMQHDVVYFVFSCTHDQSMHCNFCLFMQQQQKKSKAKQNISD